MVRACVFIFNVGVIPIKKFKFSKNLLSEREYLKMIFANAINRFGDSIDAVAFGWMVYELTGSKTWLTIILGVNFIPTILFQPFAGALANYLNKKKTVIFCDIMRGVMVMTIGLLFIAGLLNPWILLVITFANSSFEALRVPCGLAMVPLILKKENYVVGMSFNQGASRVSELFGMGASGVVIAVLGVGGALLIDAVTFLLSAFVLMFIKLRGSEKEQEAAPRQSYLTELKEGFRYFRKTPIIFAVCILCVFINIFSVPWDNLKVAFVSESLHLGAIALSVSGTCSTIGLLLGTAIYPMVAKKIAHKLLFIGGGGVLGVLYFLLVTSSVMPTISLKLVSYGVYSLCFGIINSMIGLGLVVTVMSNIEAEFTGRVGSIFNAMACASLPIGSFAMAFVTPWFSVNSIYIMTGIASILVFCGISFHKAFSSFSKVC